MEGLSLDTAFTFSENSIVVLAACQSYRPSAILSTYPSFTSAAILPFRYRSSTAALPLLLLPSLALLLSLSYLSSISFLQQLFLCFIPLPPSFSPTCTLNCRAQFLATSRWTLFGSPPPYHFLLIAIFSHSRMLSSHATLQKVLLSRRTFLT